jgi:hypothetical protein
MLPSSGPGTPAPGSNVSGPVGGNQIPLTGRGPIGPAAGGPGAHNPYEVIPTIRVTGKGKMMAVKVQMLDDGLAIFQVQVDHLLLLTVLSSSIKWFKSIQACNAVCF